MTYERPGTDPIRMEIFEVVGAAKKHSLMCTNDCGTPERSSIHSIEKSRVRSIDRRNLSASAELGVGRPECGLQRSSDPDRSRPEIERTILASAGGPVILREVNFVCKGKG